MGGIAKGLKAMEQAMGSANRSTPDSSGLKVRWLKLEDGQSIKVRFINELDKDSQNYSEDRDLAIIVSEHTNPKDYKRKAVCTNESDGRCFGCEMARKETAEDRKRGSWRPRLRFYTNLLVDDGLESPYVAVWSQGVGKQSAFSTIREYVMETGSVSNLTWRMKRQGTGTDTTYVLLPTNPDTEPFNWKDIQPYNLEKVVRELPYAEQEDFYLGFDTPTSGSSSNIDW
jgi:hypothetical protein